jgi:hypothetical protein
MTSYLFRGIGVIGYLAVASWVWGYCCARCANNHNVRYHANRQPSYYYDEFAPWFLALLFPIYLSFIFVLARLARAGEQTGLKAYQRQKLRIELEQRIRVEQEKIQQEAMQEVESSLRRNHAA